MHVVVIQVILESPALHVITLLLRDHPFNLRGGGGTSSGLASDTIYTLVDIARFIFSWWAPKRNCASYRSWFIHFQPINLRVILPVNC